MAFFIRMFMSQKDSNFFLSYLWFLAIGWWFTPLMIIISYVLLLTIIGWGMGVRILNKIPIMHSLIRTHTSLPTGRERIKLDFHSSTGYKVGNAIYSKTTQHKGKYIRFLSRYLNILFVFHLAYYLFYYVLVSIWAVLPFPFIFRGVQKRMKLMALRISTTPGAQKYYKR